jgi:hypothetical protein
VNGDPRRAIEQVQLADERWSQALEASVQAPPDLGFTARVRAIANAAEQEAAALRRADALGLAYQPHPGARHMQLSHELRPAARSRRGPPSCGSALTRPSPSWGKRWKAWRSARSPAPSVSCPTSRANSPARSSASTPPPAAAPADTAR